MTSFFRGILQNSSPKDDDSHDGYSADYSFAMEYKGPPVSFSIPEAAPIDICSIPTASMADSTVVMAKNFSLPVVQPIIRSGHSNRKSSGELKSDFKASGNENSPQHLRNMGAGRVPSRKSENSSHHDQSSTSSGTLGFSDCHDDSNRLSGSSDVEDLGDECKAGILSNNSSEISSHPEDSITEASGQRNRTTAVTFLDSPSSFSYSEESEDEPSIFPEKPVVSNHGKKGLCHRCPKRIQFGEKEACIVCCAKYCSKCVIRAMGSMPEGRKCITCIGYRIDESKRGSLGKCSRMLKRLLGDYGIKQIMKSEVSCEANQLPPCLIWVNGEHLCKEELVKLQSCPNPPKKLRPGRYWYDKDSGFWGKEGEKPSQIISVELPVKSQLMREASHGDTNITINSREITRIELRMLKFAGVPCEGNPNFWLAADGSCKLEGMKNVLCNLWKKKRVKLACGILSLPFPSTTSTPSGADTDKDMGTAMEKENRILNKILLVGCDQSGTCTIFKQAKMIYKVPFSEDEKQNIKHLIQRNIYRYICILLEECARFEEEYLIIIRRLAEEPGPSVIFEQVEQTNVYSLSPNLKAFGHWLLEIVTSGQLDVIFPAATRENSFLVEQLWKHKAFQATYKRRNEIHALPRIANHFLDRAPAITREDYEPSEMDLLFADGSTSSDGIASMEFSFPNSSQEGYMEYSDHGDTPMTRYQLIRVQARSLGEKCKWLDMFEDVDLVLYCISLTDYDEYYEDINGLRRNKMIEIKKHFETMAAHPCLSNKTFLVILNKFDLLEEKIDRIPLTQCEWFQDFNPVISNHPHNPQSNNNPPLAQRAFHYIAVKFKRAFASVNNRKLFVTKANAQDSDSIDNALKYGKNILKWNEENEQERRTRVIESASTEPSISV